MPIFEPVTALLRLVYSRVTAYHTIVCDTTTQLDRLVGEMICENWQPYGPMTFNGSWAIQVMVKFEVDDATL